MFVIFVNSVDPFTKKDWYDVKAPSMFTIRQIGKTMVTRTAGTSEYFLYFHFIFHALVLHQLDLHHDSKQEGVKPNTQNKTTNFIGNWKITNYITFPPANSL